jgi:hypothetical protein
MPVVASRMPQEICGKTGHLGLKPGRVVTGIEGELQIGLETANRAMRRSWPCHAATPCLAPLSVYPLH